MADKLIHQPACPEFDLPQIARRRRWILLSIASLALMLILLLAYTQTHSFGHAFLKSLASDLDLWVEASSFRFVGANRFVGKDLQIFDKDKKPLFGAQHIEMRFGIWSWFVNSFLPKTLKIDGAKVALHQSRDGSRSMDPLLDRFSGLSFHADALHRKHEENPIEITNSRLSWTWEDHPESSIQVSDFNYSIKASGSDEHSLSGRLEIVGDETTKVEMNFGGDLQMSIPKTDIPPRIEVSAEFDFENASGRLDELAGTSANLVFKMDQNAIQSSMFFGDDKIIVKGPFDFSRNEWHLKLKAESISRPLLNLVSLPLGLDFGKSKLRMDASFDWSFGGSIVSLQGKMEADDFEIIKGMQHTDRSDLFAEYDFQYRRDEESLRIQQLHFNAKNEGEAWLNGMLKSPTILSWGNALPGIKEPDFEFAIQDVDLRLWGGLFGMALPCGRLTFDSQSNITKDGRKVTSDWKGCWAGLEMTTPAGKTINTDLTFDANVLFEGFRRFRILGLQYDWTENALPLLTGEGRLSYDIEDGDYSLHLISKGELARILSEMKMEDWEVSSGNADLKLRIITSKGYSDIIFDANVEGLEASYLLWDFTDHRLNAHLECNLSANRLQLNTMAFQSQSGFRDSGTIRLRGDYDRKTQNGTIAFETVRLDRHFFGPALGDYLRLENWGEGRINIKGEATFTGDGESHVASIIKLENLQLPKNPLRESIDVFENALDLEVHSEAKLAGNSLKVEGGKILLSSAEGIENAMDFDLDIPLKSNSSQDALLRIAANRLDLSNYIDWAKHTILWHNLFPRQTSILHFPQTMNVKISADEFYLTNLALTNLVGQARLGEGILQLDSMDAKLNGGKVSGGLALKETGDSIHLSADLCASEMPLSPMLHLAFNPTKKDETFSGLLHGRASIEGHFEEHGGVPKFIGQIEGGFQTSQTSPINLRSYSCFAPIFSVLDLSDEVPIEVSELTASVHLSGAIAEIETLKIDAKPFQLSASGKVALASPLKETPLHLPLKLSSAASSASQHVATLRGKLDSLKLDWEPIVLEKKDRRF